MAMLSRRYAVHEVNRRSSVTLPPVNPRLLPVHNLKDIYVAIMGATGVGKSSFIELCTMRQDLAGHALESCTVQVQEYTFELDQRYMIHLIDTPGFDDTNRSYTEVLREITSFLGTSFTENQRLSGILYLQRISDVRFTNSTGRNLRLVKKLCGKECFPSIVLGTTFWEQTDPKIAEGREFEYEQDEKYWKSMVERGSKIMRLYKNRESALRILRYFVNREEVTLRIQKETITEGRQLDDTGAGREVDAELHKQREKHEKELKELKREREDALRERDLEEARQIEKLQAEQKRLLQASQRGQESLQLNFEKLQEEKLQEYQQLMQKFQTQQEELARMKSDPTTTFDQLRAKEDEVKATAMLVDGRGKRFLKKVVVWANGRWQWLEENPEYAARMAAAALRAGLALVSAASHK